MPETTETKAPKAQPRSPAWPDELSLLARDVAGEPIPDGLAEAARKLEAAIGRRRDPR